MAEQDNRRSGGESRVGHPASRRTSRLRDTSASLPLVLVDTATTKSGNRKNKKSTLNVDFVEPSFNKRALRSDKTGTGGQSEEKPLEQVSAKKPRKSRGKASSRSRSTSATASSSATRSTSRSSSALASSEDSSSTSTRRSSRNKSQEKAPVAKPKTKAVKTATATQVLPGPSDVNEPRKLRRSGVVVPVPPAARTSNNKKKNKKKSSLPTEGEPKQKRQKTQSCEPVGTSSSSSAEVLADSKESDDKGRYPLRRQVRFDSRGSLIPIFPPSPSAIALAQGRKVARRTVVATWTLSHSPTERDPVTESEGKAVEATAQLRVTLRRSTRVSHNTGSCVSSRRSSRAGKVGSVNSWTMSLAQGQGQNQGATASASTAAASAEPAQGPSTSEPDSTTMPRPSGPAPCFEPNENSESESSPSFHSLSSVRSASTSGSWITVSSGSSTASTAMRELYDFTSESDDNNDVGRLQALLESRGLPPHLFGALGPRMHHLLNRSMTVSSSSKAQQLLLGLQATGDETQQLQAVIEMCQMLIMGNEDTLTGFPVKDVVPALITLLTMDHNFVMMNHACRALTYMMEALPRSSTIVVDAVPVFLEKLKEIQCMDVAEQSLTALEALSRRHSKNILMARGVSACLKFLDFFSITAQRAALAVTANCCQNVHFLELSYVADSLPILASRLTRQSDKKCVESICLSFCRLVESFQNDPIKLLEIASPELLTNLQQLLVESPPVISTSTFIGVLRMLTIMCATCPNLAHSLLKQNMAETLCYLLTGSTNCGIQPEQVELVPRSPHELYEMTCLIGELMPRLPTDGIFSVDELLERGPSALPDIAQWQWRDDGGRWHSYSMWDSRLIEAASLNHESEVTLNTRFSAFTVNLNTMMQISEEVGSSNPVRRRVNNSNQNQNENANSANGNATTSSNGEMGEEERDLASGFVRALFATLYEVYSSSAGPAVRCKCLRALLRMVHFSSPELLKEVLKKEMVASHIAGMLASHDIRIVVGAIQMASILMQKLPDVFGVRFTREGVTHELKLLATFEPTAETPGHTSSSGSSLSLSTSHANLIVASPHLPSISPVVAEPSPSQLKLSEVLSRKRKSKRSATSSGSNRGSKTKHEDVVVNMSDMISLSKSAATGSSAPRSRLAGASSKTSSFLASLNPARWGRSSVPVPAHSDRHFFKDAALAASPSNSTLTAGNKEKVKTWVRDTAQRLLDTHFSQPITTADVLSQLTGLITNMRSHDTQPAGVALKELCDILEQSDISPFEVNHSGLVQALLQFLTEENNRDARLRIFLHVFANLPVEADGVVLDINPHSLSLLVTKLNNCVSQLEQLPVKVHDLPAGARGGTSALRFFNTHQLKCNLQRHPDCTNLKQWKGGSVKIDPLALVQAIERYLVVRGYGRVRGHDSGESDDDNTEEDDIDDTLAAVVLSQGTARHQLQFLINDNVLPYNMTVYQAIRQFANLHADASETDTDSETPMGHSAIWIQTHTIQYRAAPPCTGPSSTPSHRKHKGAANKSQRKPDHLWTDGTLPPQQSPLTPFLTPKLPDSVTISDASLEVLSLLRVLHGLNRHWGTLYCVSRYEQLLPLSSFVNPKIAAKASRQLQDPLVIMTGNLPLWLQQIAVACPFLLPFETRQLLFYATSFDRDRALQRLLDTTPDLTSTDSSERVTPRLERRKRTISRTDILKQAEMVIQDLGSSRALLEVQYDNEVGTGLGPTLEFYALVSRELQRSDLELWSGSPVDMDGVNYVHSSNGLFPAPIGHSGKLPQPAKVNHSHLTKLRTKFRFLGKLMAKAVMDSRLLDMSFSPILYRWLLGHEHSFQLSDLLQVCPDVHRGLAQLLYKQISPDDLAYDFTLPGFPDIELRKGGSDIPVTVDNVDQYIQLVVHWRLVEGVSRQMEALREGFETVFPLQQLHIFYPEELDSVFCGSQQQSGWDLKTMSECFRPDHGYTLESRAIRFLLQVLTSYTAAEQRLFLQFVTGSPRLPVGGFKSLSPPLTIVRKDVEGDASADSYLPSVMTCVNYLKLPDYSTVEVMRNRLELAAREGSHSFHLS